MKLSWIFNKTNTCRINLFMISWNCSIEQFEKWTLLWNVSFEYSWFPMTNESSGEQSFKSPSSLMPRLLYFQYFVLKVSIFIIIKLSQCQIYSFYIKMFQVTNKCKTHNFATYFDTALLVEKTSSNEMIAKNCGVQIPSTKVTPVFFLPFDQIL